MKGKIDDTISADDCQNVVLLVEEEAMLQSKEVFERNGRLGWRLVTFGIFFVEEHMQAVCRTKHITLALRDSKTDSV